jgi:hypothetical protein
VKKKDGNLALSAESKKKTLIGEAAAAAFSIEATASSEGGHTPHRL